MAEFYTDVRDTKFVLFEQLPIDDVLALPRYKEKEIDRDTLNAVVDEANKYAKNVLWPMNAAGDREGCSYDNKTKKVHAPKVFHEHFHEFGTNGWSALANSSEWGGQGMPYVLALAADDIFVSANLSFCLNALLTTGCSHLIETWGTDELRKLYCEKMYTLQWGGTMCLTEAGAGSDVGASRAKAKKEGDHYLLEGEKVFISAGEHDLADNIVHAVLARIEGAPAGTKGLSLFLVPKVRVKPDGTLGEPNDVECTGIEHKMGIHGSPTCTLSFGGNGKCHAWLLGEEGKGMRAMFQMMNEARIHVGLQGSSLASGAYQIALRYAKERVQGRHILQYKDESAPATTIINHPDVKQMLMWQKAIVDASRALLLRSAVCYDLSQHNPNEQQKNMYTGLLEILTPICKAYCSDQGFYATTLALQTLGGYGYISEFPIEQYVRDSKIASIYEGTNGIQAMDLVGRKLPAKGGMNLMTLAQQINALIEQHEKHELLAPEFKLLAQGRDALADVSMYFAMTAPTDPLIPVLNATPYLDLFGQVVFGWLLLEQAAIAYPKIVEICKKKGVKYDDDAAVAKLCEDDEEARFYDGKVKVAQFYARRSLPLCQPKADVLKSGDKSALTATL
ncbi:MAG: acyl-CoA dehydrogenase [Deltaproteobacteria bacterium]|nr:acyl-CoA dehydrogenase [Deltaproteobacteria bacterium]